MRLTPLLLLSGLAAATIPISPLLLPIHITQKQLLGNLQSLQDIASANNNTRAFGLPGYRASADFILNRVRRLRALGVTVTEQPFNALFAQVDSISLTEGDRDVYVFGLTYSPSTSAEGITADLLLAPAGVAGCDAANYPDATGKIVLVQRWACPDGTTLGGPVRAAVKAGAEAVIVYNNVASKPTAGTLSAPDPVGYRAAGWIGLEDGEAWKARLEAGETVTVHFQQTQSLGERETWNIIAETRGGDADAVIMIGAHLDSVQAGAGINDDGSGTSLVLELLEAAALYTPKLKLRFAFWGAEENGLLGSKHYVSSLAAEKLQKIRAYLNFDMVSRGYFGVFDGDGSTHGLAGPEGSAAIESLFVKYLEGTQKVTVTPAVFTGGSDYQSFMNVGIPVGGLHTGTGVEQDACYHQACDTYENANGTVLTKNAKAAAYVLAKLAVDGKKLIPKWYEAQSAGMRLSTAGGIEWGVEEGGRHVGCGDEEI